VRFSKTFLSCPSVVLAFIEPIIHLQHLLILKRLLLVLPGRPPLPQNPTSVLQTVWLLPFLLSYQLSLHPLTLPIDFFRYLHVQLI